VPEEKKKTGDNILSFTKKKGEKTVSGRQFLPMGKKRKKREVDISSPTRSVSKKKEEREEGGENE